MSYMDMKLVNFSRRRRNFLLNFYILFLNRDLMVCKECLIVKLMCIKLKLSSVVSRNVILLIKLFIFGRKFKKNLMFVIEKFDEGKFENE